jgi:hypothetical protein
MSIGHSHDSSYSWTLSKHLTFRTPQPMHEKRINGFVNLLEGKVFRMNTMAAKYVSLTCFIERLLRKHLGMRLWVYIDNTPVHRSKVLKKWLAAHSRFVLKPLPEYSPDINPQEMW